MSVLWDWHAPSPPPLSYSWLRARAGVRAAQSPMARVTWPWFLGMPSTPNTPMAHALTICRAYQTRRRLVDEREKKREQAQQRGSAVARAADVKRADASKAAPDFAVIRRYHAGWDAIWQDHCTGGWQGRLSALRRRQLRRGLLGALNCCCGNCLALPPCVPSLAWGALQSTAPP